MKHSGKYKHFSKERAKEKVNGLVINPARTGLALNPARMVPLVKMAYPVKERGSKEIAGSAVSLAIQPKIAPKRGRARVKRVNQGNPQANPDSRAIVGSAVRLATGHGSAHRKEPGRVSALWRRMKQVRNNPEWTQENRLPPFSQHQ